MADSASILRISPLDNVVVATAELAPGQLVQISGAGVVTVMDPVPPGHKLAAAAIARGESVIKFGVDIGTATNDIPAGSHVHVHNLESERMRGDRA